MHVPTVTSTAATGWIPTSTARTIRTSANSSPKGHQREPHTVGSRPRGPTLTMHAASTRLDAYATPPAAGEDAEVTLWLSPTCGAMVSPQQARDFAGRLVAAANRADEYPGAGADR